MGSWTPSLEGGRGRLQSRAILRGKGRRERRCGHQRANSVRVRQVRAHVQDAHYLLFVSAGPVLERSGDGWRDEEARETTGRLEGLAPPMEPGLLPRLLLFPLLERHRSW